MHKLFLLTTGMWRVWLAYNTGITAMTIITYNTRWAVWAIQYVLLVSQTSTQMVTAQPHGAHSRSIHGITSRYHSVRKSKLSTYCASCSWTESVIPIAFLENRSPDTFEYEVLLCQREELENPLVSPRVLEVKNRFRGILRINLHSA